MAVASAGSAALATAALLLSGCGHALDPPSFAGGTPQMRPERFFDGETRSTGVLETAGGAPSQRFSVQGHGRALPGGRFQLDQTVAFQGQPPKARTWIMRRLDEHHYTASLTDAAGPVSAEAWGDLFHITYPLKGVPLGRFEQWIYLQPDGCTVINEATARVAGIVVRRVSERISRVDAAAGCR